MKSLEVQKKYLGCRKKTTSIYCEWIQSPKHLQTIEVYPSVKLFYALYSFF